MTYRITLTKEHVGKAVYAVGTGNNARRGHKEPTKVEVISFGRKYAKLKFGGSRHEESCNPYTGAEQSQINAGYGGNAGYAFYESLGDIEKEEAFIKLREEVRGYFDYMNGRYRNLTSDQLEKIKEWVSEQDS